jgi:hypothetical protein
MGIVASTIPRRLDSWGPLHVGACLMITACPELMSIFDEIRKECGPPFAVG